MTGQGHENVAGIEAAQCDNLPYLARQMCMGLIHPPV